MTHSLSRRNFTVHLAAMLPGMVALSPRGWKSAGATVTGEEVTHTSEAIHQEVTLPATPQRVYTVLTDAREFGRVVQLSGAMAGTPSGTVPAVIGTSVGSAFTLFGGQILGRHLELVPGVRLVQAWRVANWSPGIFSIARFALTAQGSRTQLVFDHTGFPTGDGAALASGWTEHYWQPLAKYLSE